MVTYAEKQQFLDVLLKHNSSIRSFCYIYHYKEETDNHYHIALRLYSPWKSEQLIKWFDNIYEVDSNKKINTFIEAINDKKGLRCYLTHIDKNGDVIDGKQQYDESEIEGQIDDVLPKETNTNNAFDIINDIVNNIPLKTIIKTYGTEYIHYYKNYNAVADAIREQEKAEKRYYHYEYGQIKQHSEKVEKGIKVLKQLIKGENENGKID